MADLDPTIPQVVDPERTVDLTRLLQIRGPLGVLNVLDTIVPVVNMGDVVARTVDINPPSFTSTDVFSAGDQTFAPPGTVHADTGALAEGVYDVQLSMPSTINSAMIWRIQHRNAANTADLAVWSTLIHAVTGVFSQTLGYTFALNERLRIVNNSVFTAGEVSMAFIFARRRA